MAGPWATPATQRHRSPALLCVHNHSEFVQHSLIPRLDLTPQLEPVFCDHPAPVCLAGHVEGIGEGRACKAFVGATAIDVGGLVVAIDNGDHRIVYFPFL